MKLRHFSFFFLFFGISFFMVESCTGTKDALTFREQDVISLFNGEDLDNWYVYLQDRERNTDPNDVFTVSDGMIRISGEEYGYISTEEEYEDYRLVFEYKYDMDNDSVDTPSSVRGVARDGGVLLHAQGDDGARSGRWMHSIEVNVIEGGTGDFIVIGDGSDDFSITSQVAIEKQGASYKFEPGSDYLASINRGRINWLDRDPDWVNEIGFWGKRDVELPLGSWNRLECVVVGDRITVYLNGVLVNEAFNVNPQRGKIQIQTEAGPMLVRKVDLIPLKEAKVPKSEYRSIFNGKDLEGWEIYGTEKWYVDEDKTLVCESGPDEEYGYLGTTNEYKDFVFTCRFLQESDGNSGIFFHSTLEGTKISGWQAEVAPPGKHSGGIYESYGRGWLVIPDESKESALKMGEWNTMKVRVKGDTVDTWLNGAHMIHLEDEKVGSSTGQIALQIHSGGGIKVRWKDLWIKEL